MKLFSLQCYLFFDGFLKNSILVLIFSSLVMIVSNFNQYIIMDTFLYFQI